MSSTFSCVTLENVFIVLGFQLCYALATNMHLKFTFKYSRVILSLYTLCSEVTSSLCFLLQMVGMVPTAISVHLERRAVVVVLGSLENQGYQGNMACQDT